MLSENKILLKCANEGYHLAPVYSILRNKSNCQFEILVVVTIVGDFPAESVTAVPSYSRANLLSQRFLPTTKPRSVA